MGDGEEKTLIRRGQLKNPAASRILRRIGTFVVEPQRMIACSILSGATGHIARSWSM